MLRIAIIGLMAALSTTGVRAQGAHSGRHALPDMVSSRLNDAASAVDADSSADSSATAAFVARVRSATAKYRDLEEAIAAGYRLLGPDFPGMGEHWVNVRRAIQPNIDVDRPPVLSYMRLNGEAVLTGVAYTHTVQPGEQPPDLAFPINWHFHSGTVDEETLLLNPMHHHDAGEGAPRLAMVHAWVWIDNPDGVFEQHNWALPFLRTGLPVPDSTPPQAAKALQLLAGGVEYYARLIEVAGGPDASDRAAVERVLTEAHQRVRTRFDAVQAANGVSSSDIEWLVEAWHALWGEIERAVTPDLWAKIEMLSG